MSGPNGSTSYGYDEYGRMTSKDRSSFSASYDYRYGHKLHDVTTDFPGEGDVTYTTGGDGKRRTRTVNSVETWYRWDAGYTVLNEEDDSGNLTRGYVDRNMAHYSSGGSLYEYYFTVHLGSTRALYDGMDDLTATYDYTPYGEQYATQNAAATTHQYTGHDWDAAANLYFAPFRYYGPDMARWMKRDPMHMIDGPNTYAYASNAPIVVGDLLGLSIRHMDPKQDPYRNYKSKCREWGPPNWKKAGYANAAACASQIVADAWDSQYERFGDHKGTAYVCTAIASAAYPPIGIGIAVGAGGQFTAALEWCNSRECLDDGPTMFGPPDWLNDLLDKVKGWFRKGEREIL